MNLRLPAILLLVGLAHGADLKPPPGLVSSAPVTPPAPRSESALNPTTSFDSFRLINERNIFDLNRIGRREHQEDAPRMDVISFVGTMDYDRGLVAFFDGSDTPYRKVLHAGGTIGQFKVTKIESNNIQVERGDKNFTMTVGQQLRRPEGGDWNLIGFDVVQSEAARAAQAAATTAASTSSDAPVAIPANADDVTRRLMEKRNKQLLRDGEPKQKFKQ